MTQQDFNKMMDTWLTARAALTAGTWAKADLAKAIAAGITDGSKPQSFATRQELAIALLKVQSKQGG